VDGAAQYDLLYNTLAVLTLWCSQTDFEGAVITTSIECQDLTNANFYKKISVKPSMSFSADTDTDFSP